MATTRYGNYKLGGVRKPGTLDSVIANNAPVGMRPQITVDQGGTGISANNTTPRPVTGAPPTLSVGQNVPTLNYTPGTFSHNYNYTPTEFSYDGPTYTPTEFSYNGPTYTPGQFSYDSQYADLIQAAMDRLQNWSYDPENDASYKAYKNQYTRAGQKAYTDAMAKNAAKTGGVASSYANAAAQQQYNNYMSQLASKVPELEQLAYGRATNNLNMYVNADREAYSRAFGEFTDAENRARNYANDAYNQAYQTWSGNEALRQAAAETAWNQAFSQYRDWEDRQRAAADTDWSNAYQIWQTEENSRATAAQNAYQNAMAAYQAQENARQAQYQAELLAWNRQNDLADRDWARQNQIADANRQRQWALEDQRNAAQQAQAQAQSKAQSQKYSDIAKQAKKQSNPYNWLNGQVAKGNITGEEALRIMEENNLQFPLWVSYQSPTNRH